jgi:hypothetical protein
VCKARVVPPPLGHDAPGTELLACPCCKALLAQGAFAKATARGGARRWVACGLYVRFPRPASSWQ